MKTILLTAIAVLMLVPVLTVRADVPQVKVTGIVQPSATTTIYLKNVDPPLSAYFNSGWTIGLANIEKSSKVSDSFWWRGPYAPYITKKGLMWKHEERGVIKIEYSEKKNDPKSNALKIQVYTELPSGMSVRLNNDTEGYHNYCIVDVSGGSNALSYPVSYQSTPPSRDYWQDHTNKTSHIVLRRMREGSFVMGSPKELGRYSDETQHHVTLTNEFYIGIYEITQAQYWNVMGENPSEFWQGAWKDVYSWNYYRPVDSVSWDMIRGGTWPTGTLVSSTFMGRLQAKTGLTFDLPTEAQWEYACRAGTRTALNNGENITNVDSDANMNLVGRYWYDGGSSFADPVVGAHTSVGSYLVNQWGLYDMHGNVWEWCLDWYHAYGSTKMNPVGWPSGLYRVTRGGGWATTPGGAMRCRSAVRGRVAQDDRWSRDGFRLVVPVSLK